MRLHILIEEQMSKFATLSSNANTLLNIFGKVGLLLYFLLIITLAFVGLWSPTVSIVLALLGLVMSVWIGLLTLSVTSVISLLIIGGIMISKIKN